MSKILLTTRKRSLFEVFTLAEDRVYSFNWGSCIAVPMFQCAGRSYYLAPLSYFLSIKPYFPSLLKPSGLITGFNDLIANRFC
jgi:hypothetical protein